MELLRWKSIDKVMAEHSELTEVQVEELDTLVKDFSEKLEKAESLEEVKILVRYGKDALDGKIAEYEEEKRLEEVRANGLKELEGYRAEEGFRQNGWRRLQKLEKMVWRIFEKPNREGSNLPFKKSERGNR